MRAIMLSVGPKWVREILAGRKTMEIRKTLPKGGAPFKVYAYCTLSGMAEFTKDIGAEEYMRDNWADRKGKVTAEFVCRRAERFRPEGVVFCSPIRQRSRVPVADLVAYGGGKDLYAWDIEKLEIYDQPLPLSSFTRLKETRFGMRPVQFKVPPQSWAYVEEIKR